LFNLFASSQQSVLLLLRCFAHITPHEEPIAHLLTEVIPIQYLAVLSRRGDSPPCHRLTANIALVFQN